MTMTRPRKTQVAQRKNFAKLKVINGRIHSKKCEDEIHAEGISDNFILGGEVDADDLKLTQTEGPARNEVSTSAGWNAAAKVLVHRGVNALLGWLSDCFKILNCDTFMCYLFRLSTLHLLA